MLPCAFPTIALLECTNVMPQRNGCFIVITRKVAFKVKMSERRVNAIIRGRLKAYGYAFGVISLLLWLSKDYDIIIGLRLLNFFHEAHFHETCNHVEGKFAEVEGIGRLVILADVFNSSFDGISDLGTAFKGLATSCTAVGVSVMGNDEFPHEVRLDYIGEMSSIAKEEDNQSSDIALIVVPRVSGNASLQSGSDIIHDGSFIKNW